MKPQSDIGLIGLAVMGENLILNMASKGFTVTAYNRTQSRVELFLKGRAQGKSIRGASTIEEFVESLAKPRKVMIMVQAGRAVDQVIEQLLPHLDATGTRTTVLAERGGMTACCVKRLTRKTRPSGSR